MMNTNQRSQASLEFLTTYGWAFLVILIMMGALSYFGILNPSKLLPERCNFGSEIGCISSTIKSNGIQLRLQNNVGASVLIDLINVSNEKGAVQCIPPFDVGLWTQAQVKDITLECDFSNSELSVGAKGKLNIELRYHRAILGKGYSNAVKGELFSTVANTPVNAVYSGGRLLKLNITDQRSYYLYQGHSSHYLWWPIYIYQEIWYVDAITGEKVSRVDTPASMGNADYKIVKCQKDGTYTGCTVDTTVACNGLVKEYGDKEDGSYVFDDNYKNCVIGNPWVGIFYTPYNDGNNLAVPFQNMGISDVGKHQVCVRYKHNSGLETSPKCMEFISDYLYGDNPIVDPQYSYDSIISYTFSNLRSYYDNQAAPNNYFEKLCYIYQWPFGPDPRSYASPTVVFHRHGTWANYWGYSGIFFGISNTAPAGDNAMTVEYKFPNGCYLRDRGPENYDYAFYHSSCGWYHYVNGADKTVYCCGSTWSSSDSGNCDKFVVNGQNGGTLTVTGHVNPAGNNYDEVHFFIQCPGATAFANPADPYTVRVISGVTNFFINEMDYSAEKTFTENLPDQRYAYPASDYTCDNLKLNVCGRLNTLTYFYHWSDNLFGGYTNPSTICVSGPQCPHANC